MRRKANALEDLRKQIASGSRSALAKAITLVESQLPKDRSKALHLLDPILKRFLNVKKKEHQSIRIGISGPPGVGKSTFIEFLGSTLLQQGKRVAVLSVDPTSHVGGGSILGDKTRMPTLASANGAFVRPSPSSGHLGGLSPRAFEVLLLFNEAAYDYILVETVGVGQSEIEVTHLVDFFVLLHLPNSGDELQAMKKGVLELADAVIVHKADGELKAAARAAKVEIEQNLALLSGAEAKAKERVFLVSSHNKEGLDAFQNYLHQKLDSSTPKVEQKKRTHQVQLWLEKTILDLMFLKFKSNKALHRKIAKVASTLANSKKNCETILRGLLT